MHVRVASSAFNSVGSASIREEVPSTRSDPTSSRRQSFSRQEDVPAFRRCSLSTLTPWSEQHNNMDMLLARLKNLMAEAWFKDACIKESNLTPQPLSIQQHDLRLLIKRFAALHNIEQLEVQIEKLLLCRNLKVAAENQCCQFIVTDNFFDHFLDQLQDIQDERVEKAEQKDEKKALEEKEDDGQAEKIASMQPPKLHRILAKVYALLSERFATHAVSALAFIVDMDPLIQEIVQETCVDEPIYFEEYTEKLSKEIGDYYREYVVQDPILSDRFSQCRKLLTSLAYKDNELQEAYGNIIASTELDVLASPELLKQYKRVSLVRMLDFLFPETQALAELSACERRRCKWRFNQAIQSSAQVRAYGANSLSDTQEEMDNLKKLIRAASPTWLPLLGALAPIVAPRPARSCLRLFKAAPDHSLMAVCAQLKAQYGIPEIYREGGHALPSLKVSTYTKLRPCA